VIGFLLRFHVNPVDGIQMLNTPSAKEGSTLGSSSIKYPRPEMFSFEMQLQLESDTKNEPILYE